MVVFCPKCGSRNNDKHYMLDNLYVCSDCKHVIGYDCADCGKFYDYNNLVLSDGKHVCKNCGRIQWGYTEWKK